MDDDAAINLGTNEKSLNPLRRDLNRANTVENPDDQLDILQSQTNVVWGEFLRTKHIHSDCKNFSQFIFWGKISRVDPGNEGSLSRPCPNL